MPLTRARELVVDVGVGTDQVVTCTTSEGRRGDCGEGVTKSNRVLTSVGLEISGVNSAGALLRSSYTDSRNVDGLDGSLTADVNTTDVGIGSTGRAVQSECAANNVLKATSGETWRSCVRSSLPEAPVRLKRGC